MLIMDQEQFVFVGAFQVVKQVGVPEAGVKIMFYQLGKLEFLPLSRPARKYSARAPTLAQGLLIAAGTGPSKAM